MKLLRPFATLLALAAMFISPALSYAQVVHIAGSDGTTNREVAVTTSGALTTSASGGTANGGAANPAPVVVGGWDGTAVRSLSVNSSGQASVNLASTPSIFGNVNSGVADTGAPVKIGCVFNSTFPTFTNGQRGDCQLSSKGAIFSTLVRSSDSAVIDASVPSDGASNGLVGLQVGARNTMYNGSTWDMSRAVNGVTTGSGVGVTSIANIPVSNAGVAIVPSNNVAVGSSLIIKATAGNLYRVSLVAGASAGFLMIFDATSAPADGAVTPKICRPVAANGYLDLDFTGAPYRFATGITEVFSTTGCFTKTASATAYMEAIAP